ncbi:hypothetical protein D7D81_08465 [Halocella sp. SP3-1]|nr:hypothetical protein D7D81_08465 [Halocella sp. SP3-1]MTI59350.1 hypothetical protein [Bacillota bacterium]
MEINIDCGEVQTHVHEFLGSTMLASPPKREELLHNHRFAGVTGPVKPVKDSHFHIICTNTDFFLNHFHRVELMTGLAIPIFDDNNKFIGHVHAIVGTTSCDFFHDHDLQAVTLIEDPLVPN